MKSHINAQYQTITQQAAIQAVNRLLDIAEERGESETGKTQVQVQDLLDLVSLIAQIKQS